jgi:single-strand DNA-binding protein
VWNRLTEFAATLKKGRHVQLVGELRASEYEKEYGNRKKFTVKKHVCEIALQSIRKLDRADGRKNLRRTCIPPTFPPNSPPP